MYPAIHVPVALPAHEIRITTLDDIAETLRHNQIECLTVAGNAIDFWFSPSLQATHRLNQVATDLLAVAGRFTAANVPLLHADVVLASHGRSGEIAELTNDHLDRIEWNLSWSQRWLLGWRYANAERRVGQIW